MGKTIWIINQYAGSSHHGKHYRSYYIAKELVKTGDDVSIIAGTHSHHFNRFPKINNTYQNEIWEGIRYTWVKMPYYRSSKSILRALNMLLFTWRLLWMPHNLLPKPDIIIVSSPSPIPVLNGFIWSRFYKIPLVFEVRDIWPLSVISLGNLSSKHPFIWFLQRIENFAYRHSDAVISLIPFAKEHMISHGLSSDKFHYIPNGIDMDELQNKSDIAPEIKAIIPKEKFLIGYVGSLGIANDLTYFIDAAKKLHYENMIHFIIVGDGSEAKTLQQYAQQLSNITFIEAIPKVQIQSLLSLLDVCFISLRKEPIFSYGVSPNKVFDYMAAHKPILYAVDSGNNIVEQAQCGIHVEPQNVDSIVDAVLKFYRLSSVERKKLGENGYNFLMRHHTLPILAEHYRNVLKHFIPKE